MNIFKSFESTIAGLLEGSFGRVFRSEVRPMEIARKLAREMDEHRTTSVSRVYVPNEYSVYLSPDDRGRYEEVEEEVIDELCAYLLEHARREELVMASRPLITFHTDQQLRLGEFGIQARLVRVEDHEEGGLAQAEHGHTMIYSSAQRLRGQLAVEEPQRVGRAFIHTADRRLLVSPKGSVIGRSRSCDIVLDDAGVSRRHAKLMSSAQGWVIEDLHSTNGVVLNGTRLPDGQSLLEDGDRIELGNTTIVFEVT
ncbi:MAG TPA: DUF3662 and FHA domain-containing protein [Solirubrobacteraceae bacterium]